MGQDTLDLIAIFTILLLCTICVLCVAYAGDTYQCERDAALLNTEYRYQFPCDCMVKKDGTYVNIETLRARK